MTYLDDIAKKIRQTLRPDGSPIPENQTLLYHLYALMVLSKGERCTSEDVHDAWAVWALQSRPGDPFLVPFSELPEEVQRLDDKYAAAICRTAKELNARKTAKCPI